MLRARIDSAFVFLPYCSSGCKTCCLRVPGIDSLDLRIFGIRWLAALNPPISVRSGFRRFRFLFDLGHRCGYGVAGGHAVFQRLIQYFFEFLGITFERTRRGQGFFAFGLLGFCGHGFLLWLY
jgi:hypothetical protein